MGRERDQLVLANFGVDGPLRRGLGSEPHRAYPAGHAPQYVREMVIADPWISTDRVDGDAVLDIAVCGSRGATHSATFSRR